MTATLFFGFQHRTFLGISRERRLQNWIDRVFERNWRREFPRSFIPNAICRQEHSLSGWVEFRANFEVWDGDRCIGKASPTAIAQIQQKKKG